MSTIRDQAFALLDANPALDAEAFWKEFNADGVRRKHLSWSYALQLWREWRRKRDAKGIEP
jgi:hypothetical protein